MNSQEICMVIRVSQFDYRIEKNYFFKNPFIGISLHGKASGGKKKKTNSALNHIDLASMKWLHQQIRKENNYKWFNLKDAKCQF